MILNSKIEILYCLPTDISLVCSDLHDSTLFSFTKDDLYCLSFSSSIYQFQKHKLHIAALSSPKDSGRRLRLTLCSELEKSLECVKLSSKNHTKS